MTHTAKSPVKRLLGPVLILGLIALVIFGLYMANRPVMAPLQGQIDARYIDISPKITARIAKLHVVEGQDVELGTLLVTLDSPEIEAKVSQAKATRAGADARQLLLDHGSRSEEVRATKAEWERSTAAAKLAEATFQRINALYKEGLISQQHNDEVETSYRSALDVEAAARAKYDLSLHGFRSEERDAAAAAARGAAAGVDEISATAADIALKAPMSAEVDKVILHMGELAPAGFPIVTLVNMDDVWAVFNLREDELRDIRMGSEISASIPALGDRGVKLSVYYVSPKGEYATWRATRQSSGYDIKTFEVRARPKEKIPGLRPGMSVLVARS
jgi:HlyD family secretion protein